MDAFRTQEAELFRTVVDINISDGMTFDFLAYIFKRDGDTGFYKVSTTTIPGAAAAYLAMPTEHKFHLPEKKGFTPATLCLPWVEGTRSLAGKFAWYPPECELRINALLRDYIELDFFKYYLRGMEYGYQKQEIVEMYLISRTMDPDKNWEALHKRAYRKEMNTIKERMAILQRKARYFFLEDDNNPPKK